MNERNEPILGNIVHRNLRLSFHKQEEVLVSSIGIYCSLIMDQPV